MAGLCAITIACLCKQYKAYHLANRVLGFNWATTASIPSLIPSIAPSITLSIALSIAPSITSSFL